MEKANHWKAKPHRPEYDRMRERLVAAGWDIACRDGVRKMTLNAVAKEADCARSSVYRYFDSKEELLTAILQERTYELGLELDKELRKISDPREQLVTGLYLAVKAVKTGAALQIFRQLGAEDEIAVEQGLQRSLPGIASEILRIDPVFVLSRDEGLIRDGLSDEEILSWLGLLAMALVRQPGFGANARKDKAYLHKMVVPTIFKPA